MTTTTGWRLNRNQLSAAKKQELNERIRRYNAVLTLMNEATGLIMDHKVVTADDITFVKSVYLDAEAEAKAFPPSTDPVYIQAQNLPVDKFDFADLQPVFDKQPPFFKNFGEAVDCIHGPVYHGFIALFERFYKKFRYAGVDESGMEFPCSWESVEEVMNLNPKLARLATKWKPECVEDFRAQSAGSK